TELESRLGPAAFAHLDLMSEGPVEVLANSPLLARLRKTAIEFENLEDFATLLKSEHFGNLRSVDLSHATAEVELLRALEASPAFERLTELDLRHTKLTATGLEVLTASRRSAGLQALWLRHNRLSPAAAEFLANSPSLSQLEHLDLGDNAITSSGCRA